MAAVMDDKYIVFKRDEFLEWLSHLTTLDLSVMDPTRVMGDATILSLHDAVVIRRQDKFASPCLATYAAMIGLVASEHPKRDQLLRVADYFEDQAKLAAEEGHKLPD